MTTILPADMIALRERAGLTRQQAADALGLHQTTLWRYEEGKLTPRRLVVEEMRRLYVPAPPKQDNDDAGGAA